MNSACETKNAHASTGRFIPYSHSTESTARRAAVDDDDGGNGHLQSDESVDYHRTSTACIPHSLSIIITTVITMIMLRLC
jgi:hypothetical protein